MNKLDLLVCVCLYTAALASRSLAAGVYLLVAVVLTLVLLCCKATLAKNLFGFAAIYSFLLLIAKSVPLAIHAVPLFTLDLSHEQLKLYLGVLYDAEMITAWKVVLTFLPEVVCGPLALLQTRTQEVSYRKTQDLIQSLLAIFLLLVLGILVCWWFNLAYLLLGWVWCLFLVWGRRQEQKLAAFALVVVSAQLAFSYTEQILDQYQLDVYRETDFGILDTRDYPVILGLVLALFFCVGLCSRPVETSANRQRFDLSTPLLRSEDPKTISHFSQAIRAKSRTKAISITESRDYHSARSFSAVTHSYELSVFAWLLQYIHGPEFSLGIAKILVLAWFSHYQCLAGLVLIVWLFAACWWYKEIAFVGTITNTLLIPALLAQMVIYYAYNVLYPKISPDKKYEKLGMQSFSRPQMEFFLQSLVFVWVVFVAYRLKCYRDDDTPKSESLRAIMNEVTYNIDKISLCILFLVGLSSIDLSHTVLLIICSVFLLNMDRSKKGWRGLTVYTMVLLFGVYVWMLLLNLTDIELKNEYWWEIIGVETDAKKMEPYFDFIPKNVFLWALFLCEYAQLVVFDLQDSGSYATYSTERVSLLLGPLLFVKKWIQHYIQMYQIWVMYVVMLAVMVFSTQNVLNFLRFVLLMIFFVVHLNDVTLKVGRRKLKVVWFGLKYFSGAILVLRYIYQFTYSSDTEAEASANLVLIGIEKYDVANLYKAMTWDSLIFLGSVLAERSLQPQGDPKPSSEASSAMRFIAEIFGKVMMAGLCVLAIFWRLGGSMLLVLVCVLYFLCSAATYHYRTLKDAYETKTVIHFRDKELKLRQRAWDALFLFCILFMLIDYGAFLLDPRHMLPEEYDSAVWIMFTLGINKPATDTYLFSEMYGYLIILVLLVIEKHCMEYLKEHTNETTSTRYELNPTFQVWNHLRVIVEELVLMFLLVTAFAKLTVVSMVYLFVVMFLCIFKTDNRKKLIILMYLVSFAVFAQYLVVLSNIREEISQVSPPEVKSKPLPMPWYNTIEWGDPGKLNDPHEEDNPTFLNLGTNVSQVFNISYDLGVLLLILVYFEYFDERRTDVTTEPSTPGASFPDPQNVPFRIKVRNLFYSISHILVLVLVLIFVSQSNGLTSLIYCLFSLAFLVQANTLLNVNKEWDDYRRFFDNFFITFLMVDLSALMLYQMPLSAVHTGTGNKFLKAVGLVPLWRAGYDKEPEEASVHYDWVVFKILTFIILRLLSKMFTNDDFCDYIKQYRDEIKESSQEVRQRTAEEFNDQRLLQTEEFKRKKEESNALIDKMLQEADEWYQKGKETSQMTVQGDPDPDVAITTLVKRELLARLSKPLFADFLANISAKSKPEDKRECVSPSSAPMNPDKISLSCKRFLLLLWYIICSHTQETCFALFFLNHYYYASIESLFFPFSVLCYAMLDNPRPSPRYWKLMLYYSVGVFSIKYAWQQSMVDLLLTHYVGVSPRDYTDPYKIGFNLCAETYSETLFYYTIWDVLSICAIICHEYILLKSGLSQDSEYDVETLEKAKQRNHPQPEASHAATLPPVSELQEDSEDQLGVPFQPELESSQIGSDRSSAMEDDRSKQEVSPVKQFFLRLLPFNSEEKPGRDLYTYTILMQILILLCIVLLYTHMDGESQDISLAIK